MCSRCATALDNSFQWLSMALLHRIITLWVHRFTPIVGQNKGGQEKASFFLQKNIIKKLKKANESCFTGHNVYAKSTYSIGLCQLGLCLLRH